MRICYSVYRITLVLSYFIICSIGLVSAASACSVAFVNQYNSDERQVENAIGVRTMDFEFGVLTAVKKGVKGTQNTSRVNVGKVSLSQTAFWINKYDFIGVAFENHLNDGMNNAGLYMGALYMPGETKYPDFSPVLGKKALGILDAINFVLGTSSSVNEAISNLQSVQVIMNAATVFGEAFSAPLHFFLKDKTGQGTVVEFTSGAMNVYTGDDINVLTNSPNYQWQLANYLSAHVEFVHKNTNEKANGSIENGSGYKGLGGDFTPSSRFVRMKTLASAQSKAITEKSANYFAQCLLNTMMVPVGMNPAASTWSSRSNLVKGEYSVTEIVALAPPVKFPLSYIALESPVIKSYSLSSIDQLDEAVLSYPRKKFSPEAVKYTALPKAGTTYNRRVE